MQKVTTYILSSDELKEAITAYMSSKFEGEVLIVTEKGFFPQTSTEIQITENL